MRIRLQAAGPGAWTSSVWLTENGSIGCARSADLPLPGDALPKVVAIIVRGETGLILRLNDHPQGFILDAEDRPLRELPLAPGTRFALPPFAFQVAEVEAVPTSADPEDAAPAAPPPRRRRRGDHLLRLAQGAFLLLLGVGIALLAVWLLGSERSVAPAQPPPQIVVAPPPAVPADSRYRADPDHVNVVIVLPRSDLDEAQQAAIATLAAELVAARDESPANLRCRVRFKQADLSLLDRDGPLDYARLRQVLADRQDVLTGLLPAALTIPEGAPTLPGLPGMTPAPFPLAWHIGAQGPGSAIAISDIAAIELHNRDRFAWGGMSGRERYERIDQEGLEQVEELVFRNERFLYCFTYLPPEATLAP